MQSALTYTYLSILVSETKQAVLIIAILYHIGLVVYSF